MSRRTDGTWRPTASLALAAALLATGGCSETVVFEAGEGAEGPRCIVDEALLWGGTPGTGGVISLEDPPLVSADHADAAYLEGEDRVVGVRFDGDPVAVPLNVLNFHEVVNLTAGTEAVAVTFCPLTGSSLAFDRDLVGGRELGVSGLLLFNNLILFDRGGRTLWSQMMVQGICGPGAGTRMTPSPSIEMTWDGWRELHPGTLVVSRRTGFGRRYDINIIEDYERPENSFLLAPQEIDPRRPPKERVLGLPRSGDGGIAFPFGELARKDRRVIAVSHVGRPAVVLWSGREEAAAVYYTDGASDGEPLELEFSPEGFRDRRTGSTWTIAGEAVSGPRRGARLEPVVDAFVAFWFAWSAFRPETVVWSPPG